MIPDYFWAKTTDSAKPGKSVLSHMNDVQAVCRELLIVYKSILSDNALNIEKISALAGLHDIGKISPGFQAKCPDWLEQNKLRKNYGDGYEQDHSVVTQYSIQEFLKEKLHNTNAAELWASILGAHHGRLHRLGIRLNANDGEWELTRNKIISMFSENAGLPDVIIDIHWPYIWWVAGLVSVSDWIGSANDWFPAEENTEPAQSNVKAQKAVRAIGFDFPKIKKGLGFGDVFYDQKIKLGFEPNDLQLKSEAQINKPGLYIIEAPMGMGKTEAALWCSYKLMSNGYATGFYFALPTQTTSNRIHLRVNEFLRNIVDGPMDARLIHANSWLVNDIVPKFNVNSIDDKDFNHAATDWFASSKRGLLAPFAVGTIDQALMSVIAVKHFFIRQFALSNKVIILDEVHSYDLYTGTLIKIMCDKLISLGCTIILLSATLTENVKMKFLAQKKCDSSCYPQISGSFISPVEVTKPEPKLVRIKMQSEQNALIAAIQQAKNGKCVLWVCNTVNKAQQIFDCAKKQDNTIEMGVLHSRFPYYRREQLEEYWIDKLGKNGSKRSGCILFSTQIVEQSVDIDADFMVSELAPTDMLLQRLGRLCRHERGKREPELWIIEEQIQYEEFRSATADTIKKMFGPKAKIYAPYILLKSLQAWRGRNLINLPSDIRTLLDETYAEDGTEPVEWLTLQQEIDGEKFAKEQMAHFESNVWNLLLDDEEGKAKTRVSTFETIQLILCTKRNDDVLTLLNGEKIHLNSEKFNLREARAIAKNIVKIPKYCFKERPKNLNKLLGNLVRGEWFVGFVNNDTKIECTYMKDSYESIYTPEKGVEIMKKDQRNEVVYEPCD